MDKRTFCAKAGIACSDSAQLASGIIGAVVCVVVGLGLLALCERVAAWVYARGGA